MTAWTAPRTWVVAEKLFASLLNTHVRDNLLYVKEVLAGTHTDKIPNAAFTDGTIDGGKLIAASVLDAQLASGIDGAKLTAATVTPAKLSSFLLVGAEFRTGVSVPSGDPGAVADTLSIFTNKSNADHEVVFFNNNTSPTAGALEFAFWQRAYATTAMTLGINNDGKLTGKGFYDSGQFSMAGGAGSNVTLNPSFPVGVEGPRFVWGLYGATNVTVNAPIGIGGNLSLSGVTSGTITVTKAGAAAAFGHVWAIY